MIDKKPLIEICHRYLLPDEYNAVLKLPYIPWLPEEWDGVLVLAESQNLSATNSEYVKEMLTWSDDEQIMRLNRSKQGADIGVAPWDDGSLKLAVKAAFGEDVNKVAVSNAVLWSLVSKSNTNVNPGTNLIEKSVKIWTEILPVLKPKKIITAGKIAEYVIASTKTNIEVCCLRLPSKTAMSRISGMFDLDDLIDRYPEVKTVADEHPEWCESYKLNKIFYACHACSKYGKRKNPDPID